MIMHMSIRNHHALYCTYSRSAYDFDAAKDNRHVSIHRLHATLHFRLQRGDDGTESRPFTAPGPLFSCPFKEGLDFLLELKRQASM